MGGHEGRDLGLLVRDARVADLALSFQIQQGFVRLEPTRLAREWIVQEDKVDIVYMPLYRLVGSRD